MITILECFYYNLRMFSVMLHSLRMFFLESQNVFIIKE